MKNDMDDGRIERLFDAARQHEPYDPKLQYGFETRVMAKIMQQRAAQKPFFAWAWRLIPALVTLVLAVGAWTYMTERSQLLGLGPIAGINNEETMLVASLTGD